MHKPIPVDALTLEQLAFHVEQARRHLGAIRRLLPGMTRIPDDEREYTNPIIDDEHAEALGAVLDVMTLVPEPFEGICDPIIWTELGDFTPELGHKLLDTWKTLRPLEKELVDVTTEISERRKTLAFARRSVDGWSIGTSGHPITGGAERKRTGSPHAAICRKGASAGRSRGSA